MLIRLFALVLFTLVCLGVRAETWSENYPFSVEREETEGGFRIVARNLGPASISVKLSLVEAVNSRADAPFPITAVIPPGSGTAYLANVTAIEPGAKGDFHYNYSWRMGELGARQDKDVLYRLPYKDGAAYRIGQAPGGTITTHSDPRSTFAVDIDMPQGTPVVAARDGTVIQVRANQTEGGLTPEFFDKANHVLIQHRDGTVATYAHLAHQSVFVSVGRQVRAGDEIGLSGNTGYSSGPHLHFVVQSIVNDGDRLGEASLPFNFYVGNPPLAFAPRFGMLAKAEYASPGNLSDTTLPSPAVPPAAQPAEIPTWQWAVALGLLILLLTRLSGQKAARSSARSMARETVDQSAALLAACNGDRQRAARLMQYERLKTPSITPEDAAMRALQRLERQRR